MDRVKQPTNAQLYEMLGQVQQQLSQLTVLVCSHNGVGSVGELQINQVAADFVKRGPEAILDHNRQWKAKRSGGRKTA